MIMKKKVTISTGSILAIIIALFIYLYMQQDDRIAG
jgi:hypothetical protein